MSKAAHTPGPWRVANATKNRPAGGFRYVIKSDGKRGVVAVASVDFLLEPTRTANAHLIASAPDLLDNLERLVCDVENKWGDPHTLRHAKEALLAARQKGEA